MYRILIIASIVISAQNILAQIPKGFGFAFSTNEIDSAVVDSVYLNSPSFKAGLKRNDLLLSVNGTIFSGKTTQQVYYGNTIGSDNDDW